MVCFFVIEDGISWGCGQGWDVSEGIFCQWPLFQDVYGYFGVFPFVYSLPPLVCGVGLSTQGRDWGEGGGEVVGSFLRGFLLSGHHLPL